jgi:hypothetical protein
MATQKKAPSKISSQAVMEEVKTLAMLGGGVVLGSVGGRLIDKVLKVDPAATGFQAKALARPVVLIAAGTAGAIMLKDKNMKMLATGVGAAGVLSGVKVILKKDLLAGLADFKSLGANEPTVFRDPVQLQVERYNPDLPELNAVYMPYPNPMDVEEENERERGVEGMRERKPDNVFMEIM